MGKLAEFICLLRGHQFRFLFNDGAARFVAGKIVMTDDLLHRCDRCGLLRSGPPEIDEP